MAVRWLCVFALVAIAGCGGGSGSGSEDAGGYAVGGDSGPRHLCVDEDDDGFGVDCPREPRDCDDQDPTITDECFRCVSPNDGCPCEAGLKPMDCTPPRIKVKGGFLVCREGTRYCRDQTWSVCEVIGEYKFVAE